MIYKGGEIGNINKGSSVVTVGYHGSSVVYTTFSDITFTTSGTWVVPAGLKRVRVDCVAGQGFTNAAAQGGLWGRVQCI